MGKLGLVAGSGRLPVILAEHCRTAGRPLFVLRVNGAAEEALLAFEGADCGIAQLGAAISAFRKAGCEAVCLAGSVARPDLRVLKPDARGLAALPGAVVAARKGDDALLRYLLGEFEKEGFRIEGAHEVMESATLPQGPLGRVTPNGRDLRDIERGLAAARAIGALDIGQAAVACDGLILAVEAQEGTDAMLARVAELSANLRGGGRGRRGVLVKAAKPRQEERVDLPTIGPATVERAAAVGLAGIAGEAGRLLIVDRDETRTRADAAGLFVFGVPKDRL